jgi:hypothetical protein
VILYCPPECGSSPQQGVWGGLYFSGQAVYLFVLYCITNKYHNMKLRNILIVVLLLTNLLTFVYAVMQGIIAKEQRILAEQKVQIAEQNADLAVENAQKAELARAELKKKDSIISVIYPIALKADPTLQNPGN